MNVEFHHTSAQRAGIYAEDARDALTAFDSPVGLIKNTARIVRYHIRWISMRRLIARLCQTTPATTAISRLPPRKFPILRTDTLLSKTLSFFLMAISSFHELYYLDTARHRVEPDTTRIAFGSEATRRRRAVCVFEMLCRRDPLATKSGCLFG